MSEPHEPIKIADDCIRSIGSIDMQNPNFTITHTELSCWSPREGNPKNQGGFCIEWQTESAGFGSVTIHIEDAEPRELWPGCSVLQGGKIKCDNACMDREFVRSVFMHLIDKMELLDGPEPEDIPCNRDHTPNTKSAEAMRAADRGDVTHYASAEGMFEAMGINEPPTGEPS